MHCCPSEAGGPSSATGWLLEGAFPNMPPVNKEDNRGGSLGGPELLGPGAGLLGPKAEPALNGCTEEAGAEPALNGCTEEAGAEDVLAFPLPAPKRKDAPGPPDPAPKRGEADGPEENAGPLADGGEPDLVLPLKGLLEVEAARG